MTASETRRLFLRYDEIGLKGKSRGMFERRLQRNVATLLDLPRGRVRRIRGRLVVDLPQGLSAPSALATLQRCFGIRRLGTVERCRPELEAIEGRAVELMRSEVEAGARSFKVEARRADKSFALTSTELNRRLGGVVLEAFEDLRVDVHEPDVRLGVEIMPRDAWLHAGSEPGPGGLPTGIGGRALALLSGGIDSPVAMWLAQKRGLHVDAVFFDTPPFTGPGVRDKVKDLARVLARSSPDALQLTIISLAELHKALVADAPERWWTLLLRRFMLRIADRVVPPKIHYDALITGDSLGQVASQTIQNLGCLEGVTTRPVLRPLVGFDKIEISRLAERVGTLAIAARPEADCCTLLAPRAPVVQGRRAEVEAVEATLPLAELEQAALTDFEVWRCRRKGWSLVTQRRPSQNVMLDPTPPAP